MTDERTGAERPFNDMTGDWAVDYYRHGRPYRCSLGRFCQGHFRPVPEETHDENERTKDTRRS